jgi:hypothetical protein
MTGTRLEPASRLDDPGASDNPQGRTRGYRGNDPRRAVPLK